MEQIWFRGVFGLMGQFKFKGDRSLGLTKSFGFEGFPVFRGSGCQGFHCIYPKADSQKFEDLKNAVYSTPV